MAKKNKKIVQCPFCNSNRLYFRRGLVSDVLISLLLPVKSYTCGSCSRSFHRFGNYFTSKQALIHIVGLIAILAIVNPHFLNPQNWFLKKQKTEPVEMIAEISSEPAQNSTEMPLLSMAVMNSTNSSLIFENSTVSAVEDMVENATKTGNQTDKTILAFNGTEVVNATTDMATNNTADLKPEPVNEKPGLQNGKLRSIYFKAVADKTRINLDLGGAPLSYTSFFLSNPDRLVVDIHGNWEYYGPTILRPENPIFSRFRIGIYEDKIRMVMDLKGQTPAPVITKTSTGLNIDVK
ncbi:AMIN domain-containing protein [Maridesulfovibrio zosterae]|uniref:AMIN domain-containing protein n=1 Tax=Maridesulfovibrio zosterae TaxID=82171 RepID=UPI0003FB36FB|nr:AMIN domain-containing protein [Maridesulfovibrio zosterae]